MQWLLVAPGLQLSPQVWHVRTFAPLLLPAPFKRVLEFLTWNRVDGAVCRGAARLRRCRDWPRAQRAGAAQDVSLASGRIRQCDCIYFWWFCFELFFLLHIERKDKCEFSVKMLIHMSKTSLC